MEFTEHQPRLLGDSFYELSTAGNAWRDESRHGPLLWSKTIVGSLINGDLVKGLS